MQLIQFQIKLLFFYDVRWLCKALSDFSLFNNLVLTKSPSPHAVVWTNSSGGFDWPWLADHILIDAPLRNIVFNGNVNILSFSLSTLRTICQSLMSISPRLPLFSIIIYLPSIFTSLNDIGPKK